MAKEFINMPNIYGILRLRFKGIVKDITQVISLAPLQTRVVILLFPLVNKLLPGVAWLKVFLL